MTYHARIPAAQRAEAERALEHHPAGCPAWVTVKDAIRIKIDWEVEWT